MASKMARIAMASSLGGFHPESLDGEEVEGGPNESSLGPTDLLPSSPVGRSRSAWRPHRPARPAPSPLNWVRCARTGPCCAPKGWGGLAWKGWEV